MCQIVFGFRGQIGFEENRSLGELSCGFRGEKSQTRHNQGAARFPGFSPFPSHLVRFSVPGAEGEGKGGQPVTV